MPKDYPRSERLASQIQRELAGLVRQELKDPGLPMVSILEVQVTETGQISLSADGAGSNDPDGVTIQVEKPNELATVRAAFFTCATDPNIGTPLP